MVGLFRSVLVLSCGNSEVLQAVTGFLAELTELVTGENEVGL